MANLQDDIEVLETLHLELLEVAKREPTIEAKKPQKDEITVESNIEEEVLTPENIKEKQEACGEKWTFIIFDIILPFGDTISDILFIMDLFMRSFQFAVISLCILYAPICVIVMHYVELHASRAKPIWRKAIEICCLVIFGPVIDSLSAIAFLVKGRGETKGTKMDIENLFLVAKYSNGIIESCLQLIWNIFLITIQVNPLPWSDSSFVPFTDAAGNTIHFPVATFSLVMSLVSVMKNLFRLWSSHYSQQESTTAESSACLLYTSDAADE